MTLQVEKEIGGTSIGYGSFKNFPLDKVLSHDAKKIIIKLLQDFIRETAA